MHSKRLARTFAASTLALGLGAGLVATAGAAGAAVHRSPVPAGNALFVQTDLAAGNTVIAYRRGSDGTLSLAGSYATGGKGATAAGATADPLASQDSLALVDGGKVLLAPNAGSDTISAFDVDGPALTLVDTVRSHGRFPASIAADGSLVEVLNAGGEGNVAGFRLEASHLKFVQGSVRDLALGNTNPPNYLKSPGEVGFSPTGRFVIVTTKASTSSFDVFAVDGGGRLAAHPVTTVSDTPVPFSFDFDAAGQLVAAEAGTSNVSTYALARSGALTAIATVSDGGSALCWLSSSGRYDYGSNAGSGTVSSFKVDAAGDPKLVDATAATAEKGTTDSVVSPNGKILYVESGGSGALDSFRIGADGSLTGVETIWNLPVGAEGLAVS